MKTKALSSKTMFNLKSYSKKLTWDFLKMGIMLLTLLFASCDGEDGMNGMDGIDGAEGPAGQDGNANVQTYTFDTSTITGSEFILPFEALTQDVLNNDVILTYIQSSSGFTAERYYPIPGISFQNEFEVELYLGNMGIYSYDRTTGDPLPITAGQYSLVKAIIIESSSTTAGKSSSAGVLSELKAAGVETNDYYQVADYYGIDY